MHPFRMHAAVGQMESLNKHFAPHCIDYLHRLTAVGRVLEAVCKRMINGLVEILPVVYSRSCRNFPELPNLDQTESVRKFLLYSTSAEGL